ncbi:MAG: DUF503 domain-containing protein [Candidatus Sericytochromatia bacterium]|nr:DUF503 domain-containing protein [Candidatus Sericytochromatia bacterium]
MIVGIARVELELTDIGSLKDKRSIVKPIVQKLMNQFAVMAAEVDSLDDTEAATLGLVLCANEQAHANRVLSKAIDWLEHHQFEAHVADVETQFLTV